MLRITVATLVVVNALLIGWDASRITDPQWSAPAAPPDDSVPTLRLLSEFDEAPAMVAAPSLCYAIGPLASPEDVAMVRARLENRAEDLNERTEQTQVASSHWVYMPPKDTREAAESLLRVMKARGIEDIAIVPNPDGRSIVSLGVYGRAEWAERRVEEVRSLGFAARSMARESTQTRYWLEFRQPTGTEFVGLPEGVSDAARSRVSCEDGTLLDSPRARPGVGRATLGNPSAAGAARPCPGVVEFTTLNVCRRLSSAGRATDL